MNTILQKRIEEAATFLFKQRGLDKESCRQAMGYILSNQWISVDEALPEYEEDVLVTNDVEDYWFSHRTENENVMRDENNFASVNGIFKITHWMSIPSLEGGAK